MFPLNSGSRAPKAWILGLRWCDLGQQIWIRKSWGETRDRHRWLKPMEIDFRKNFKFSEKATFFEVDVWRQESCIQRWHLSGASGGCWDGHVVKCMGLKVMCSRKWQNGQSCLSSCLSRLQTSLHSLHSQIFNFTIYIYLNCKFVKFVKTCQGVGPGPGAEMMESCNRKLLHVCLGLGGCLILQKMNENELSNLVTKLYVQV